MLGLLTLLWLLGTADTTAGIWRETDEVLDSALTETAQRLLLLPAAAMAEPDTAAKLATLGPHTEHVVYQVFDQAGQLQLHSHDAPPQALDPGAPDGLMSVNALLARVEGLVAGERAFAANTAHELRTPLAAARTQAQRLALASSDPAAQVPAQALLRQLDRLTRLATRLLQLARIESGVALQHAPVDLVQLATLVADDFSEALRSGRLRLQVQGRPLPVHGDVDALGIALRNLIDNALKHGGDDAVVTVHIAGQSLRVENDGPGVPTAQLPGLLHKFERGNGAVAVDGSGLGLSLVATIARQSGARLVLQSPRADGHGFDASLHFDGATPPN